MFLTEKQIIDKALFYNKGNREDLTIKVFSHKGYLHGSERCKTIREKSLKTKETRLVSLLDAKLCPCVRTSAKINSLTLDNYETALTFMDGFVALRDNKTPSSLAFTQLAEGLRTGTTPGVYCNFYRLAARMCGSEILPYENLDVFKKEARELYHQVLSTADASFIEEVATWMSLTYGNLANPLMLKDLKQVVKVQAEITSNYPVIVWFELDEFDETVNPEAFTYHPLYNYYKLKSCKSLLVSAGVYKALSQGNQEHESPNYQEYESGALDSVHLPAKSEVKTETLEIMDGLYDFNNPLYRTLESAYEAALALSK